MKLKHAATYICFMASAAVLSYMALVGISVARHPLHHDRYVALSAAVPQRTFMSLLERDDFKFLALTVFLVSYSASDQTYNVPTDWNNSVNTVEVISHAGTASAGFFAGPASAGGGGGGGGGYAKATNISLTPGGTTTYRLRDAGAGDTDADACWFKGTSLAPPTAAGVRGGSNAPAASSGSGPGGAGAVTTNGIGSPLRGGGNGAAGTVAGTASGGGGGGAAGLNGVGGNASGTTGGTGDGGNTAAGANGTQYDASHGSGGGGAGGGNPGGNGGTYGGAAGGGGVDSGFGRPAGTSRGGLIVLIYTPTNFLRRSCGFIIG